MLQASKVSFIPASAVKPLAEVRPGSGPDNFPKHIHVLTIHSLQYKVTPPSVLIYDLLLCHAGS
jgi:hypothetical protein